ncbi:hypothetical protein BDZ88DRAFT_48764 [Geranomyces variabilis]|nr:hypothetical protein BDZ88DRAFT_48764 [Geranomyces variabilis]KAJ3131188.1 hypothetical protein HDU90_008674 [Geranomyces variabilis]
MRGPDGLLYFDPKCHPRTAEFPPPSEPPHPWKASGDCKCYACAWRALAEQNPYPAFPNFEDIDFQLRCSPGVMVSTKTDHDYRHSVYDYFDGSCCAYHARTNDDHSAVRHTNSHRWAKDPGKQRRALNRYLDNPYPPLYLEAQVNVRPVQFVRIVRGMREERYDPLLVEGESNHVALCTERFIDFDLIDASGTEYPFRMQINFGDCNSCTGWYATVRDRSSARLIGNAMSAYSYGTLVSCFDDKLLTSFVEHDDLPPVSRLTPFFKDPEKKLWHGRWHPDYTVEEEEAEADPVLDPYKELILKFGGVQTSRCHQVELMFAVAAKINEDSFTLFNVPHALATDFKFALIKKAVGNHFLLPDELLRMIASCDPAILHWQHVPSAR